MTSLSISGIPPAGNPSVPLLALHGPWLSSGGLRLLCGGRSGRAARAASTPARPWAAPGLSHRVPHNVLTPSSPLLRPPLLTHGAAPSVRRRIRRRRYGRGTSAADRKEVTMIQRG
jgi:hypothetical protein